MTGLVGGVTVLNLGPDRDATVGRLSASFLATCMLSVTSTDPLAVPCGCERYSREEVVRGSSMMLELTGWSLGNRVVSVSNSKSGESS